MNTAVGLLSSKLTSILDRLAPVKKIQIRSQYVPWLTYEKLMQDRDDAQKHASNTQSGENWQAYKHLRNTVNNRLKSEKRNCLTQQFNEKSNDSSKLWRSIKSWLQWKTTGPPTQLFHNGQLINSPSGLSQTMNNFFVGKTTTIRNNLPPPTGDPHKTLRSMMVDKSCSFQLETGNC